MTSTFINRVVIKLACFIKKKHISTKSHDQKIFLFMAHAKMSKIKLFKLKNFVIFEMKNQYVIVVNKKY